MTGVSPAAGDTAFATAVKTAVSLTGVSLAAVESAEGTALSLTGVSTACSFRSVQLHQNATRHLRRGMNFKTISGYQLNSHLSLDVCSTNHIVNKKS